MTMRALCFIAVLAVVASTCVACRNQSTPANPPKPLSSDQLQQILGPGKEQVALLALKTNLDETAVKEMLAQYLRKHDFAYGLLSNAGDDSKKAAALVLDPEANGSIADTVRELATHHNIPANQVASLIMEYRVWRACGDRLAQSEGS